MLYLIPTPIGHLEDITLRALRLLKEVDLILAEDTRLTGRLLKHYDISTPMQAFHAHNEHSRVQKILDELQAGKKLGLVSDAGTPGISDPGFLLVRACLEAGIQVESLPGPTAFVPALTASGLPCDRFHFEGFLPHKKGRKKRLEYLASLPHTFILYESPHRIARCLHELEAHCGPNRPACLARELSKIHEEFLRGTLSHLAKAAEKRTLKGEMVLIVGGQASDKRNKTTRKDDR